MIPTRKSDWVEAYRKCGLSEPLIHFALDEPADPLFSSWCERELLEQPFEHLPDVPGPKVTPLWHLSMAVVGCRKRKKALEFVGVSMEEVFAGGAEPVTVIAHNEQGLWAWLFRNLIESAFVKVKKDRRIFEKLREAADRIGFRHFDDAVERVKNANGTYEDFIRSLK